MKENLTDEADIVVDLYTSLKQDIETIRQKNPTYQSGDGIHPKRGRFYIESNEEGDIEWIRKYI